MRTSSFRREPGSGPSRPRTALRRAALASALACSGAGAARAQLIHRPETVWGEVPVQPEGLVLGSVELLAGLLIGLLLCWLASVWLLLETWRLLGRVRRTTETEPKGLRAMARRRRTLLAWITYAVAPVMGIAATLLARHRTIFGVDVALVATLLALAVIATGIGAFLVSGSLRNLLGEA